MRLQRLRIINVQAHIDSVIEIGAVTTLVGNTNAGKTSVLRALRGLIDNAPIRTLLRDGCDHMIVEVTLISDEDKVALISWKKGTKANEYHVVVGHDHVALRSVGAKAPDIVESLLQMGEKGASQGERYYPNFRTQIDPPPFIYTSESERLNRLTQISGIGRLQAAMRSLQKDLKSVHHDVETTRAQEEQEREDLKAFQDVEARLRGLASIREYVSKVLQRLRIQKDLERLSAFRQSVKSLLWIDEEMGMIEALRRSLNLLTRAAFYRDLLIKIPKDLSDWHLYLLGLLEKVATLRNMLALKELRNKAGIAETEENNLSNLLAERIKERTEWLEVTKTCPLCGQPTTALRERVSA